MLWRIQRPLDNPTTTDLHEALYMAVQKIGLIEVKVTMVCAPPPPPRTTEPGCLCSSLAYTLWLMCQKDSVWRTWKPLYELVNHDAIKYP